MHPEDRADQMFCDDRNEENQRLRDKQLPSASGQLSQLVEQSIVSWLKTEIPLLQERILSFECRDNLYGYRRKYREIYAISGTVNQPEFFFEIKASGNPRHSHRLLVGRKQLQESLQIADYRWLKIRPCLIYVDMAPSGMLPESEYFSSRIRFCGTLADLQNDLDDRVPCLRLSGEKVWQQILEVNLTTEHDLWSRTQVELKQHILERQEREQVRERKKAAGITDFASQTLTPADQATRIHQVFCSPVAQGETTLEIAFRQATQRCLPSETLGGNHASMPIQ